MNLPALLDDAKQHGVTFAVVSGKLTYRAPKGFWTAERKTVISEQKAALIALLSTPETLLPSEEGKPLLRPFLLLIQAAHSGELPDVTIRLPNGSDYGLSDYICKVSAGIWYGLAHEDSLLPAWLENLRRLQDWWDEQSYTA